MATRTEHPTDYEMREHDRPAAAMFNVVTPIAAVIISAILVLLVIATAR